MKTQHFFTHKNNVTSINITLFHYQYLVYLSNTRFNGNISLTIDYLLKKYLVYLYKISISQNKRTLTATYQPKTKNYIIRKIRIQPTYWGELNDLRNFLGYSISFIIRIMLDWEMQQEQMPVISLIAMPDLDTEALSMQILVQFGNNYSFYNKINHTNYRVFSLFSCPAA
ncbi:MAG: hypothetical protein ACK42K_07190 [Leptonema sp. (in: bacteria)]